MDKSHITITSGDNVVFVDLSPSFDVFIPFGESFDFDVMDSADIKIKVLKSPSYEASTSNTQSSTIDCDN